MQYEKSEEDSNIDYMYILVSTDWADRSNKIIINFTTKVHSL